MRNFSWVLSPSYDHGPHSGDEAHMTKHLHGKTTTKISTPRHCRDNSHNDNQPTSQSINQAINQSSNQPSNQRIIQPINQTTYQSINPFINPSINQLIHPSTNPPINQSAQMPFRTKQRIHLNWCPMRIGGTVAGRSLFGK